MTALPTSSFPPPSSLPVTSRNPLEGRVLPPSGWWWLVQIPRRGFVRQSQYQLNQLASVLAAKGKGVDVYMSQCIFRKTSRSAVDLTHITHAYVDLDVYNTEVMSDGKGIDIVARMVLLECDDFGIPKPSCIIHSGRGLYLKWFWRQPVPSSEAGRAVAINKALVQFFRDFGADRAAVDMSRILRVVGSVNSRSGNRVEVLWTNDVGGDVLRYDFNTFADEFLRPPLARVGGIAPMRPARAGRKDAPWETVEQQQRLGRKLFHRADWHLGVLADLRRLAELRHDSGIVQVAGAGCQAGLDLFGHLGACQLAMVIPAPQLPAEIEAWGRQILPDWYIDGEFSRHCSTLLDRARQAAAGERVQHGGKNVSPNWTYNKDTLIDLLEITPAEMRQMTRLIDGDEKRHRDREAWRASHTGQDRTAYLAANSVSRDKPWKAEGISRATWYRRQQAAAGTG